MSGLIPTLIVSSVCLGSPSIPATPPATAPAAAADSPDVQALIRRVTARYGEAKTYRDSGTGTTTYGPKTPSTQLTFETAFIRGGGFRWSFQEKGSRPPMPYVVWSPDGRTWNSWWKLKGTTEQFDSLRMALAGPTGISNGLTMIVPDLLRPDGGDSWLFLGLVDRKIRGTEEVDGVACEILEARRSIGGKEFGTVTAWVDASGAIRRYRGVATIDAATMPIPPSLPPEEAERFRARPKFESITEFRFSPTFDGPVAKEDLAFTPPA
jgi:hypothetical protein